MRLVEEEAVPFTSQAAILHAWVPGERGGEAI